MTRTELTDAAESLRQAADAAQGDGTRDRLRNQSETFESFANADRGPDHGQLAHSEHILTEIAAADDEAADHIEAALDSIRSYRETVEGV
jgi:hypothetical protein